MTLVWGVASSAGADHGLGPNGQPITTSDYSIDLTPGPVTTGTQVIGLGGAFAAIAKGVEGGLHNPAAVAYRGPQWPDWLDYWLTMGLTFPLDSGDFYNSGNVLELDGDEATKTGFYGLSPGAYLQLENFGIGVAFDWQFAQIRQNLAGTTRDLKTTVGFLTTHLQSGYGFLDNQLIVGGGLRLVILNVNVTDPRSDSNTFDAYRSSGAGFEAGVMVRPHGRWWRLGGSIYGGARTRTSTSQAQLNDQGHLVVDDFLLPRHTEAPWSGRVGFAFQVLRPFNPRWITAEERASDELAELDEREQAIRRNYAARIERAREANDANSFKRVSELRDELSRRLAWIADKREKAKKEAWRELRERVRYEMPRRYLMVSTELRITGRVENGVGVESFLAQTVQRSGRHITVSPRIGMESEVWPHRLKLRAGTYAEPSRFRRRDYRMHATFGFDLALFQWEVFGLWPEDYIWQLSGAVDLTAGYQAFSVSLGGWY